MKKAIGVVSFGTSSPEAERSCIRPVEQAVAQAFSGYDVFRAFTSPGVVSSLNRRGERTESETELIARLRSEGYEEIALVTTHIIPGASYEKLTEAAGGLRVSEPLIACEADEAWMAELLEEIAAEEERVLLAMGHGAEHAADSVYGRIQTQVSGNVFVACAAGAHTLETVLPALEMLGKKEITLVPLMLVAGSHAQKDLAGDGADSWKSVLEARGFDVRVRMQGLGALKKVQQRYVEKARSAVK